MPSTERAQGQVRLADNGPRVGRAQAKQNENDRESQGSCGRSRSQAGQGGEAG